LVLFAWVNSLVAAKGCFSDEDKKELIAAVKPPTLSTQHRRRATDLKLLG
jgi:hypothetical protein